MRRPVQQCAESARRQSLPTKRWRDKMGHLHGVTDWTKLDSADRFARRHSPNGEREPRCGSPVLLKPLYHADVMPVGLRPRLLDSPTKEACGGCILSEGAMARGVLGSPALENELMVESNC